MIIKVWGWAAFSAALLGCGGIESQAASTGAGGAGAATHAATTGTTNPASTTSSAMSTSDGAGGAGGTGGGGCFDGTGGLGAGGGPTCSASSSRYVTRVVSACFGGDEDFGHDKLPDIVLGPPKGAGCCQGSLDVCSLGDGGTITLAFDANAIVDGPGVDFIVFENAFDIGKKPDHPFADLATVEVSEDGVVWKAYPCTAKAYPYGSCAGWRPVLGNTEQGIDPLDPAAAGGDQYDLADVGLGSARFVRITDRADMPGSFDLDAIGIVNARCP